MTRLSTLRAQLASLRRARSFVRAATAYSALVTAILWALAGVFLLDLLFELEILPRVVVFLLAAAGVVWAGYRFTRPLLGVSETDEDMALLVERQQNIDSDLVAALQFESPAAAAWGSPQLEGAVIDYVAHVGSGIDVFEGFSRQQMVRRGSILGLTAAIMLVAACLFPGHALAFVNRLLLGSLHYPTDTIIEQVIVNRQPVLLRNEHGSRPQDAKCAEGRPIELLIHSSGQLPAKAVAQFASTGPTRNKTEVELRPLSLAERLARLQLAEQKLQEAARNAEVDISLPWQAELGTLLRCDAPAAAAALAQVSDRADLPSVLHEVQRVEQAWPATAAETGVYVGELSRLLDDVRYKLIVGDAWTDPASIAMIPLPIVEPHLTPQPPEYARGGSETVASASRQLAVVEGSAVQVALESTNRKRLTSAWMLLKTPTAVERLELKQRDAEGYHWELATANTPLGNVTAELRYEIQVLDADGLSLEAPLRGSIRIKPDRSPNGTADVVHKVVLPTAAPSIEYRASDDYGLSQARLLLAIERHSESAVEATPESDGSETTLEPARLAATETITVDLLPDGAVVLPPQLPLQSQRALQLSTYKLAKGDRVKITLETVDYRGRDAQGKFLGKSHQSEPLVLEISDESGVLAAISAADEHSEQRLTDIIKRQLGIGETP